MSLIRDLDVARRTPAATVAVLAVPCEAVGVPADAETAALTTYSVTGVQMSGPQQRLIGRDVRAALGQGALPGLDLRRITTVACQPPV